MNRYSLAAFDPKTKKEVLMAINLNDEGIYEISDGKSKLAIIDGYTMQFKDEEALIYDLIDRGILDRDVKLKIRYKNKGNRETPVLYSTDTGIKPFVDELVSKNNDTISTVANDTEYFNKLYNRMLRCSINKPEYIKFLYEKGYINDHLYNRLEAYKLNKYTKYASIEQLLTSIVKDLSSYKVIRNIYIGTKRYKAGDMQPMEPAIKKEDENSYLDENEKNQLDLYLHGGEDELYSIYDKDEISEKVYRKIIDHHFRGQ